MALNFYQYTKSADKYGSLVKPEPVKPSEPGLLSNMGRAAGSGALSAVGGIFDFAGADGIAKQFYGWSDDARQSMSQEAQVDMAKPFFSENDQGDILLGEGLTDLDTWLLTMANVAGQFAPTAIPGAGLAGAATKALKLGEAGAKIATAAGMGATGGAAATGQGMEQARQEWMQMPDELKLQSDLFKNTIREMKQKQPELDGEALWAAAEDNVAERLASEVQTDPKVLLANFAGSAIADPIIGRALTGARLAKSGAFRSAAKGFAIEGSTEAGQAAVQEYGINQALSQIDGRDPMDGVAVAALNEGVAGGTLGGAAGLLGGFANRKQEEPVRDPEADAIRDKNPDLASAFDGMAQSAADREADLQSIIGGLPAISQPALEGELLGANVPSTFADNQRPQRQQRPFTPYAGQIEDKDIIFAADGRTEAERNPAMEGEWLSPEQRANAAAGFIENAPIDLESEQVKQAKADMERMRNQPRQITDKNIIFSGDGRPQQAAQEYVDNLQRQANQAASVPRLPQKDIIFAGDQSGVRVKGNGEVYQSAREAMTSKQARAMKRSGTPVEAVPFGDGWGWRVKESQPEQVNDIDVVELTQQPEQATQPVDLAPIQLMKSGKPFSTEAMMIKSASYKEAAATGAELEPVKVEGGFGFRVKTPSVSDQAAMTQSPETDTTPQDAPEVQARPALEQGQTFEDDDGTLYRIEGIEGNYVSLTRNPDMLSEKRIKVPKSQYEKYYPTAPALAAEQAPEQQVTEPVKWFGTQEKADAWVAKQPNPNAYRVEPQGKGRYEIFEDSKPARDPAPKGNSQAIQDFIDGKRNDVPTVEEVSAEMKSALHQSDADFWLNEIRSLQSRIDELGTVSDDRLESRLDKAKSEYQKAVQSKQAEKAQPEKAIPTTSDIARMADEIATLSDDQRKQWFETTKVIHNARREPEGTQARQVKMERAQRDIEKLSIPELMKNELRERLDPEFRNSKPSGNNPQQRSQPESKLDQAADAISDKKRQAAEKLKAIIASRKGQLNSGVDPEVLLAVAEVGALSIAEGAVKFAQWVRDVLSTTRAVGIRDEDVKPFLKEAYGAMYANPEKYGIDDVAADAMDNPRDARKIDIDSIVERDDSETQGVNADSDEIQLTRKFLDGFSKMDRDAFRNVKDNTELRKLAGEMLGLSSKDVSNIQLKAAQEAYETVAIVDRRSTIRKSFMRDGAKQAVTQAVRLYDAQPNLNMRSANSSDMQAYSTPAPMSAIANIAAGVNSKTRLYEPTAGNGLLMMFNDPQNTFANELDPVRASSLAWTGFNVSVMNGAMNPISNGIVDGEVDVVLANPPFGKLRDDAGNPTRYDFSDYRGMPHSFGELDHVIAAEALSAMKDDGKAVLILGASKEEGDYRGNNKAFLNWLYSNYNVVHHVEADGKLYQRQGAAWPTQMIVVYGRERQGTGKFSPMQGEVKRYSTWSSLYDSFDKAGLMGAKGDVTSEQFSAGRVLSEPYAGSDKGIDRRPDFEPVGERTTGNEQGRQARSGKSSGTAGVVNTGRDSAELDGTFSSQPDIKQSGLVEADRQSTSESSSERRARGAERVGLSGERNGKLNPIVKVNEFQARYDTRSGGFNDNVLTPVNIASYTQQALDYIANGHSGGVDGYVMEKLGYKNLKDLHKAFMGLQIDAVALAVDAIETGRAIIIGDQTGVGKGRQAAGIIRYAMQQGKIPVFITQKPNLFTDMYDDLHDIGAIGVRPLIMNNKEGITRGDDKLFNLTDGERKKLLTDLARKRKMPDGYDYLSLTYSQISSDTSGFKTGIIDAIAPNAIFILDESHTAAGQESKLGKAFQNIVQNASGVTYLSATYAKRPDNMLLYTRTDLGLAMETSEELVGAVDVGGIGMQAYIAGKLAEAGQMIRRERSFDGISIDNVFLEDKTGKIKQQFDAATTALRAIQSLSAAWKDYVDTHIKEQMQRQGGFDTSVAGNKADTAINVTLFSSVVHNYIAQLTLALKANKIAEVAIARHKSGERPVIALENTMGSALREYMDQTGLSAGDSASDLDFGKLLTSMADRVLAYSIKQPGSKDSTRVYVPISKVLDPRVQELYREVKRLSVSLSKYAIPASPIDVIRTGIEQAGLSVSEVTGREYVVDYTDKAKIKHKSAREKNDRRGIVDDFNSGKIDVLILNQAGSTGLSIHASEKFKDQKPRHMIVAQPSLDINTFMQMLGRVNRTGQVVKPSYSLAWLSLPSEKRPAAVLAGKMRKLNANTSGNDKSATSIESIDLLNDYGNKIVKDYVTENKAELAEYNDRLVELPEGDEAVYFLGKLAVLPVDIQEKVISDVETLYSDLINFLNATGQNELSTDFVDLDAKPIAQKVVSDYKPKRGVFSEPAYLTQVDVKTTGKAPSWDEVQEALASTSQAEFSAIVDAATSDTSYADGLRKRIEEVKAQRDFARQEGKKTDSYESDLVKLENKLQEARSAAMEIENLLGAGGQYSHGSRIKVKLEGYEHAVTGVVVGADYKHKVGTGNPLAPSKFTFKVMLADRSRTVPIKLSQAKSGLVEGIAYGRTADIAAIFDREASLPQREERFIMTGNLLAAQNRSKEKGRIIPFTTKDGRIIQGMLMPRKFKPESSIKQEMNATLEQMLQWLKSADRNLAALGLITRNGDVTIGRDPYRSHYFISMPRAASRGKPYWGNPNVEAILGPQAFTGGGSVSVRVSESQLDALAKAISDINPLTLTNDAQISDFKRSAGIAEPGFSKGNIKFSKQNTIKAKPARGVNGKLAKQMVANIMQRLNGAAGIKVVVLETQAEAEKLWQMSLSGDLVRGAYNRATNTAYVIAENVKSLDELREVVAHEVIGHGGLQNVIGKADYTAFIDRLKQTRNNRAFAEQWAQIDNDYEGFSENDKAEELFAYFVQNKPVTGPVKFWWNALKRFLHKALASVGLAKAGDPDVETMQDMLESIRAGFMSSRKEMAYRSGATPTLKNQSSRAESFARWFGDSKVVNDDGSPRVVYHGTNADFSIFSAEKLGEATGAASAKMGFFFAGNPNVASSYADTDSTYNRGLVGAINRWTDGWYEKINEKALGLFGATARTDGGNVMPVYLAIKNPLVVDQAGKEYREQTYYDILVRAKEGGYDGVVIKNTFDEGFMDLGDELTDVYIAFEPTQIKSATGNNGDFDPTNPDIRFSKTRTSEQADALDKLGLGEEAVETVAEQAKRRANETVDTLKSSSFWKRLNEGIFDGLAGIKQAEEAAGITDPNKQGYVSARLASGLSDILHGVFHYGAPEWRDGVVQRKADTKGLLEVFGMLGDDLNDWLAWMGANRAERLMAEGRENNLSQADIDELKAMAAGKEALFEQVRQEYNKVNSAIIDLAEEAGLLSTEQRGGFDEEWYVPFFRNMENEVDPEMSGIAAMVHGPRSRKGIAGQSAQIKELKGGRQSTKDLLENIIQRQSTMIDAAIKNKAMAEVVSNLEGTPFMQAVDSPDIAALSQTELNLLQKVKVMRNGKAEAYTVTDPALLRGLLQIHTVGNQSLLNRMGRSAKRFLTAGITLSPDFIVKNFVRDAAHAWMINKDGFRFGADSVAGLRKAFAEDEAYRDLIFSGAAFQGGYVHGADPDAAAQQIRRALRSKGLAEKDIKSYMDSLITKGGQLLEAYRTASDKVENANRLSTYEAALAGGKSRKQAAYEAKDLMDYSLKGNFALIGTMIDMLPFFNARLQGMSKLVRAMKAGDGDRVLKVLSANLAMKGLKVAAFSLALAAMNDDDERYQELPDWDKDANWHFFIGDEHFRIPKPFELGILFGTMPERMFHYAAGSQPGSDLGKAAAHAVWNTLALNPIPQLALPVVEVMTNKSFFKGSQIEGMGDAQRKPEDRYNAYTSETAKQIGAALGVSPKMVEHLILGYTGTLGGYVLGMSDIAARQMLGIEAADTPISRYPVIKAFYQGDAPKTATKFQDEFYKALEEATEAHGSYKRAVEEGDVVRQQDLKESESQALGARVALSRIQRRLSELNKQAQMVNNNQSLSGEQKRQKLDDITKKKNALYQSAYLRHKLGEW